MVATISPRVQRPKYHLLQQASSELRQFDGPQAGDIWSQERRRVLIELQQLATAAEQQAVAIELGRVVKGEALAK